MKTDSSHTALAFALMALFGATAAVADASQPAIRLTFLGLAAIAGLIGGVLLATEPPSRARRAASKHRRSPVARA